MIQWYILSHGETTLKLTNAPEGWDNLAYTITRNETYHGLFISFSGTLRFCKEGKTFIDTVLNDSGFEAEIGIEIKEMNLSTRAMESKIKGVLNFSPDVFEQDDIWTTVSFISSKTHQKFKTYENTDISFNRKESLNGTILPGFTNEFVDLQLRAIVGGETATCKAVYPFEMFGRILQVICDLDYNPVLSSVLGRTIHGYIQDGQFSKAMISKGLLMRGVEPSGDEQEEGKTMLTVKFKDLFTAFANVFFLGLGIEWNPTSLRWEFVIEPRGFFYQTTTLFRIDKNSISELKYKFGSDFMFSSIKTGFRKYENEATEGISGEYNTESEFATPITVTDAKLDITSPIRADGLGIKKAIDNRHDAEDAEQQDIDEDVFILDSVDDNGTLKTRQTEGFQLVDGIYGENIIYANLNLTPARNMVRWGEWLNSSLSKLQDKKIRFQSTKSVSAVQSQTDLETYILHETKDFPINQFFTPRWSGKIVEFEAPLTREHINIITNNPYGLVEYWDYINKEWRSGWIKECSTDRVDRETTWMLYVAVNLDIVANNLVYVSDGLPILLMSGNEAIKTLT